MELPLPSNVSSYEHQVAGHGCSTVKNGATPIDQKLHVLHSKEDRCIYKPIQAPPKGDQEVQFYQMAFSHGGSDDAAGAGPSQTRRLLVGQLRRFLPEFFGVYRHPATGVRYIKLGDLLHGFARPSVMDVKMGARSYEPTASQEKRSQEIGKYAHRERIGFFVTGLRVWHSDGDSAGHYEQFSKRYGSEISPDNMHARVIQPLINAVPDGHRLRLLRLIIGELEALLAWFEEQDLMHFYASSILLGVECCPEALARQERQHVLVRLIDFTHVLPAPQGCLDEGYLLGLRTLVDLCRACEQGGTR